MNNQKLPNAQTVFVLGIVSILGSCCFGGIIGLVCSLIGLNLYKKDNLLYQANPDLYSNYQNLSTGRILNIIGLVLSILGLLAFIFVLSTFGFDGYREMLDKLQEAK